MADIVTSRIFVDGEKGITAAKLNDIVASSVIQPAFYTSKPTAGTADPTDIALILKSGAYAQVPISTLGGSATQAQIWSTRLRSFNSVGNCTFECDQRNAGALVASPVSGGFLVDRMGLTKVGTMVISSKQTVATVPLPGTSFNITNNVLTLTLTTQEASLGAGDLWCINQFIEGPLLREIQGDVSSLSLLVASTVVGLKFSVALRDPGSSSKSLTKLCTIPATGWQLIQLPNLPVFPSGNFSLVPGNPGYLLSITLACGTTFTAPAADTWQNGNFVAAPGMDNFASKPVNSVFQIAFIQHEPGAVCSTLMDKPFTQNYDECLRYYCKSYPYATKAGTPSIEGYETFVTPLGTATNVARGSTKFPKPMAKGPTATMYTYDGTANGVSVISNAQVVSNFGVNSVASTERGIGSVVLAGNTGTNIFAAIGHYAADSGW